ncbi:PQQ-binding-like beta-propeller repeat protein [Planctomicrobium sp. SH668]|uniref:PQQ-binding-like beta-propeller repeat protein n=1 Tax=Planctomicrobium sp. SH668 TaxID=3448126 RepID=UPI003F5C7301
MRVPRNRRDFLKTSAVATFGLLATARIPSRGQAQDVAQLEDQWVSFRNGVGNPGIAHTSLPAELKQLWTLTTPDGTVSTAAISKGRVYIGTLSGDFHCLDLKTGEIHWTYRSVEVVEPNSFAPGFNAPATLDEQAVYIGDDQGGFHAIDRATGKRRWHVETNAEIVGGAQRIHDQVIFGSHDGHLYSFDAESGEQKWSVDTHGPVNATPCIAGKYTFTAGCDQPIFRVIDIEAGKQHTEIPLDSLLIGSAAYYDKILYFGTGDGIVFALDWEQKKFLWQFSVPGREQQIQSSPAVTEHLVIIGSRDKRVYCLNRMTGELKWEFATRSKVDSCPVVVGDRVFFGSSDRNVYGLDIETGEQVWKHQFKQAVIGSPAIAENCLVIATESNNGQIVCFG